MGPAEDSSASRVHEPAGAAVAPPLPGARPALVLLLSINLINYVDRYVLAAVEPRIQDTFFSKTDPNAEFWMGILATAFIISYMFAALVFGWLADRMSRWLLVGISVILWSLATGASGLAGTFAILLITRLFVGVGEAGYGPSAPTIISDFYPVQRRGAVLAWFYMAIPVGSALGYVVGGFFEHRWGWRSAFYAVVAPGLILGIISFFMREPRRGQADPTHGTTRTAKLADYLVLLKTPSYVLDTIGMALMTFAIGGISFWIPKYIADYRQAGSLQSVNATFGIIVAATGLTATLAGGIAGDKLRARFPGSYFLVSAGGMFIAVPFVLLMLYLPFPWAWVAIGLAVFFLFFNTGPSNTILANVTHPSVRATAFALNIFLIHILGDVPAPPILGRIGHFNWNAAFTLVAIVMAAAGAVWAFGARYLARDTELASYRLSAESQVQ